MPVGVRPPTERTKTTGHFSCGDCGREWNAFGEVHCAVCHAHFGGYAAFDRHIHQQGENVTHRDPGAIRAPKGGRALLTPDNTPLGTVWRAA